MSTRASIPAALLTAFAVASPLVAQERPATELPPAVIVGQIVDAASGTPVPTAAISFTSTGADGRVMWEGLSNDNGRFRTAQIPSGQYIVEIRAFGFRTVTQEIAVLGPSEVDLHAELVPEALALEPVIVTSQRRNLLEARGFYERRDLGMGRTWTRNEIEAVYPAEVSDLIRSVPGYSVSPGPLGRAGAITLRGGCEPDIFIDGVRLTGPLTLNEVVTVEDLEGIEVYRGSAAPVQFTRTGCGTILAWTRQPGASDGAPFSWRRLAAAAGLVLIGLAATR